MKTVIAVLMLLQGTVVGALASMDLGPAPKTVLAKALTPADVERQLEQEQKQLRYDAAENAAAAVMRRYRGCSDGEFAELIGHASVDEHIPARILAAVMIVESTCNPNAVSKSEAIGLMQVVPRVWRVPKAQLTNPTFNVGFAAHNILAPMIRMHGIREGLHHYNGMGVGCSACDGEFPEKVMRIAGYAT